MRDALPRRADRAGDRTAAAGAHAARRRGRPSARRGSRAPPRTSRDRRTAGACGACTTPHAAPPATHLLSNGRYAVMLTAAGSGYSRWRDLASPAGARTRRCDDWGSYIFLRDVESGEVWSAGYQPMRRRARQLRGRRSPRTAPSSSRRDGTLTTTLEVVVSAEDDAEVRRVSHHQSRRRARARSSSRPMPSSCWRRRPPTSRIRPSRSCSCRPSIVAELGALLATRRRRVAGRAGGLGGASCGRRRRGGRRAASSRPTAPASSAAAASVRDAVAVDRRPAACPTRSAPCSIRSSRCAGGCASRPAATARIAFWTMVASSREALLDLVDKHHDANAFERAATLAWTQAQVQLRHLGIEPRRGAACSSASPAIVLYADPSLRPSSDAIRRGAAAAVRRSGRMASPATCRSCCCASTMSRTSTSSASCCARTNTGG